MVRSQADSYQRIVYCAIRYASDNVYSKIKQYKGKHNTLYAGTFESILMYCIDGYIEAKGTNYDKLEYEILHQCREYVIGEVRRKNIHLI